VLTTKITLPLNWHKDCGFSSCSLGKVWFNNAGQAVAAEPVEVCTGACAQAIGVNSGANSSQAAKRAPLKLLDLVIELSILFCDWTVYFQINDLSRFF
jgi:hypothetical protein